MQRVVTCVCVRFISLSSLIFMHTLKFAKILFFKLMKKNLIGRFQLSLTSTPVDKGQSYCFKRLEASYFSDKTIGL